MQWQRPHTAAKWYGIPKKVILTIPGAEIADAVMGCGSTTGRNVDKAEKLGIELDEIERMPE